MNNAGVNYNLGSDNSVEFAQKVVATNYYGTKNMIKAMIPLMRHSAAGARVVNVSSRLGRLHGRRNVSLNFVVLFCAYTSMLIGSNFNYCLKEPICYATASVVYHRCLIEKICCFKWKLDIKNCLFVVMKVFFFV